MDLAPADSCSSRRDASGTGCFWDGMLLGAPRSPTSTRQKYWDRSINPAVRRNGRSPLAAQRLAAPTFCQKPSRSRAGRPPSVALLQLRPTLRTQRATSGGSLGPTKRVSDDGSASARPPTPAPKVRPPLHRWRPRRHAVSTGWPPFTHGPLGDSRACERRAGIVHRPCPDRGNHERVSAARLQTDSHTARAQESRQGSRRLQAR
jgi:hypothetical protein